LAGALLLLQAPVERLPLGGVDLGEGGEVVAAQLLQPRPAVDAGLLWGTDRDGADAAASDRPA
jgi:hypothetical protein